MELIYIWIDKFRNIDDKGYNFSNQYEIVYDKDSNNLTINFIGGGNALINDQESLKFDETKRFYLKDFFHPNILNISAIIGKNSSGKSNVIDFILTAISTGNRDRLTSKNNSQDPTPNYVLIFKKDGKPYFFGRTSQNNINNSFINCNEHRLEKLRPDFEWDSIFYTNVADNKDYIFEGSSVYNFSFASTNKLQSNKIKFVTSNLFEETWKRLNPENTENKRVRFVFNPNAFLKLENNSDNNEIIFGILKRYRKAIYEESTSNYNRFTYSLAINLFSFLALNNLVETSFWGSISIVGDDGIAEPIATLNPKIVRFLNEFTWISELDSIDESNFNLYRDLISDLQLSRFDFGNIEKFSNSIIVDFNDNFKRLVEGKYEVFNTPSLISHDWSRLSSGMKAYLNLFSQLYYVAEQTEDSSKSLLICIDEGDLYLHPEWQKNFLNDLIWFVSTVFESKKIQLILTSHSPFLISDLPKESVILIDDNSNPTRQLNEASSFGANIHQLFTNQFFLKGGSIGQFAKDKITTLLKEIKTIGDDDIEIYQRKIEMIGEPVLRFRLEDELKQRLKELSNETQIRWHQQQILKLQNS